MVKKSTLRFDRPRLFSSAFTRRVIDDSGAVLKKNAQDLVDSNVVSTASFRYDPPGVGLRSTQQLPVDFSKFENHTFFNSAEVNVNVAFERIINEFPFDGTRKEVEEFLDSLTGFERWVFDTFPRNMGYLNFSGSETAGTAEGTYIEVKDFAGSLYPSISKKRTGENVLDPGLRPFTVEMQLYVPDVANLRQVVCQKISGSNNGITLGLTGSASTTTAGLIFAASSGSRTISAEASITKGQFNHVVATFDRRPGFNNIKLYVAETLVGTSSNFDEMGEIGFTTSSFFIGSGTTHTSVLDPEQTFSGSIDEFRVFHDVRTVKEQQLFAQKAVFTSPNLKLYFKFNEPTGSFGPDSVVIDSSGNSLHANITNFSLAESNSELLLNVHPRATGSVNVPMTYEKRELSPILFPTDARVISLNENLLSSASSYDDLNLNLITKLIPKHYFLEGQQFEALSDEDGTIDAAITGSSIPGSAELGSSQLLASFLYVWAKFFDEIKMFTDQLSNVIHVDYDKPGFVADQFLPLLADYYGFDMPALFIDSSIEQFIDAENVGASISTNQQALQYVQNQIWRRILTNILEVIRSKGTLHSIKSLFRSMGINPDDNFKIREFGGPTSKNLSDARDDKSSISTLLDFSGSLASVTTTVDSHGVPNNKPFIQTTFLSGNRSEPGFPEPKGAFVVLSDTPVFTSSNESSDGLFTSGSFTYEALYRFPFIKSGSHAVTQSLMRMYVTGSETEVTGTGGLVLNLVAVSGSNVTLFAAPTVGSTPYPTLTLPLTGADVMDGAQWHIAMGRQRNDEIGSYVSSSYFVRATRQGFGKVIENHVTSALFFESGSTSGASNVLEIISSYNVSGTFVTVGSQSVDQNTLFLNNADATVIDPMARSSDFSGRVGQIRFWSKALTEGETLEHARNFRSVGVEEPLTNFNFVTNVSGSWERLRVDASCEQPISKSNTDGTFEVFDFSQNEYHVQGSGFEGSKQVLAPERFFFSQLSSRFDEASSNNKVRIRSFNSYENVVLHGGEIAPIYEIPRNEAPQDDTRFSIDFSIMDALDEDIVRIFSTFDSLDNVLGDPELVFSQDYPSLADLRDVYFNRLTDKIRLREFFEFFKWFDGILGISTFVEQLVPRKTRFLGTNFVIESHMLERPKHEYQFSDIYLGENDRHGLKGTILLQQFASVLKRY